MHDDIILFVKLVNCGGFSQVARLIKVNQSTITRRIQALEKKLNSKLIKRNTRNFALTRTGSILYENFKNYETVVNSLLAPIYSDKLIRGELALSLPRSLSSYLLMPFIGGFIRDNPELNLRIYTQDPDTDIDLAKYDLIIAPDYLNIEANILEMVFQEKIVACCTPEYISKQGIISNILDGVNHRRVKVTHKSRFMDMNFTVFHESDDSVAEVVASNDRIAINHYMFAKQLILAGNIIGSLPESYIKDELKTGQLVRIMPEYHLGYTNYYLLSNIDKLDPRFMCFNKFLEECIKKVTA